jgi:hypothetical protein
MGGFVGTDGNWGNSIPAVAMSRIFTKLSSIIDPSYMFVFLDMRQDTVNWSNFMNNMTGYYPPTTPGSFIFTSDYPGMYHNKACGFSFSDGHSEMKRWLDGRTTPPLVAPPATLNNGADTASPGNPDIYWIQDHSTRAK